MDGVWSSALVLPLLLKQGVVSCHRCETRCSLKVRCYTGKQIYAHMITCNLTHAEETHFTPCELIDVMGGLKR